MDLNIVERKGSWYAYKGKNLAQGRLNAVELLKQDGDLASQLETEVRLALSEFGSPPSSSMSSSSFDNEETPEVESDDATASSEEASVDSELYLE